MKRLILIVLLLAVATDAFASKKNFKGLFGSYRREKFTENEARNNDLGVDVMLSTLLPITPVVKSQEAAGGAETNLNYATFFNLEGAIHYSINYHWQLNLGFGYYSYETRRENTVLSNPALPLFHQFEMTAIPIIFGVKYRFSRTDIVPYVGLGAGISLVTRKAFYDYSNNQVKEVKESAVSGQAAIGVEFYIASRMGIRLEASAFFMKLKADTFDTGAAPSSLPIFYFQPSTWSVRYASGLFFLF